MVRQIRKPGMKLGDQAAEMVIHPLENVADPSEDITLWKTVVNSAVGIGYNNENDRIFEVTFKALPDTTKDDGQLIGKIGAA